MMDLNNTDIPDRELLSRFVTLLTSSEPVSIPRQTLLGAISHYISTLPSPDHPRLLAAIVASTSLWDSQKHSRSGREAVRLGIQGALSRLDKEPESSRWWRRRDPTADWLDAVASSVLAKDGPGRTHSLVAILTACSRDNELNTKRPWKGKMRADVEDEMIMQLAEMLQRDTMDQEEAGLGIFCDVAEVISGEKLRILDLQGIQHRVLRQLYMTLATSSHPSDSRVPASQLSRTAARLFEVMFDGDDGLKEAAWTSIRQVCIQMRGVTACLPHLDRSKADEIQNSGDEAVFDRHKAALFAFLLPASKALSIILDSSSLPSPAISSSSPLSPPADLALEALHTLSSFAPIIDRSQGGLETYHRVLHGMTDTLVATGGTAAVRSLLTRAPGAESASPAEGLWWLTFEESLVRSTDEWGFRVVMEPLIEKCIETDNHRASFEAAHSLSLAIVRAAADTHHGRILMSADSAQPDQRATSQLLAYCELLVQQHIQGKITQDQLVAAYPMVLQAASKHSFTTVNSCLAIIRKHLVSDDSNISQTRRLVLIACAPSVPPRQLRPYLEDLAQESTSTSVTPSQKDELANAAYRMVLHDLPDSSKVIGMEWWAEWRDRFSGEVKKESFIRARL